MRFGGLMNQLVAMSRQLPRKWIVSLVGALFLAALVGGPEGVRTFAEEPVLDDGKPKFDPGAVEVRFADNSVLKLTLKEEKVEIVTPYGKLLVPVADIYRIEFATRVSEADEKRIPVLIANLASEDFHIRD